MAKKATILVDLFCRSVPLTTKDSGVYGIVNLSDGRIYIGSSKNLSGRRVTHKFDIRRKKHAVKLLQEEIWQNPENFDFVVIERIKNKDTLLEREQFWLDFYQAYNPQLGYNRCRYAASILGFRHSEEVKKEKFCSKLKGRTRPPRSKEWCDKISKGLTGRSCPKFWKPVIKCDQNFVEIERYKNVTEATLAAGVSCGAITQAIKRYGGSCAGFKWKYA